MCMMFSTPSTNLYNPRGLGPKEYSKSTAQSNFIWSPRWIFLVPKDKLKVTIVHSYHEIQLNKIFWLDDGLSSTVLELHINYFSVHTDQTKIPYAFKGNEWRLRIFALLSLHRFKTTIIYLFLTGTTIIRCSHYELLQLVSSGVFAPFLDCSTVCCCFPTVPHCFPESSVGRVLLYHAYKTDHQAFSTTFKF